MKFIYSHRSMTIVDDNYQDGDINVYNSKNYFYNTKQILILFSHESVLIT